MSYRALLSKDGVIILTAVNPISSSMLRGLNVASKVLVRQELNLGIVPAKVTKNDVLAWASCYCVRKSTTKSNVLQNVDRGTMSKHILAPLMNLQANKNLHHQIPNQSHRILQRSYDLLWLQNAACVTLHYRTSSAHGHQRQDPCRHCLQLYHSFLHQSSSPRLHHDHRAYHFHSGHSWWRPLLWGKSN